MLVGVAGDCNVSAYGVELDAESVAGSAGSRLFVGGSPDVEPVPGWGYFDPVVRVVGDEVFRRMGQLAGGDAVVEVDAADALAEDVAESDAVACCRRCLVVGPGV